ncbi:MAG: YtoQ family protein [candidate division Zixibacteria bacterium]|nr:YtoQ family protein [candidate division Zixibacteria bacterium]MBU1470831.1 YtoQ family protein [candidate division Zixibacteria bacterium]MBU2625749.1 YtoQ family protein [candidate division Zixibacteria bacterium]
MKQWKVYLSGEIHSDWRDSISKACTAANLPISFFSPVPDHAASDSCGVDILGQEETDYWKDVKGAGINAIRTRTLIKDSDIVIVRFGDKYKQWNSAFIAGFAAALNKPLIVQHPPEYNHALKEVDTAACAVAETEEQLIEILKYIVQ